MNCPVIAVAFFAVSVGAFGQHLIITAEGRRGAVTLSIQSVLSAARYPDIRRIGSESGVTRDLSTAIASHQRRFGAIIRVADHTFLSSQP
jgi:hypothetical protein